MIAVDAEPIDNRTPLKRINLTPVWPAEEIDLPSIYQAINDHVNAASRKAEADRIWRLVVGAAEACGACTPSTMPDMPAAGSGNVAPEVGPAVIYDGIYSEWADTAPSEYFASSGDAA